MIPQEPLLTQAEKGRLFRALHERHSAFIIPNPWDVGSARLLAQLGFEALATTSARYAFSAGQRDNAIHRDDMLAHVATIASATDLPVSAETCPKSSRKPSDLLRQRDSPGAQSKTCLGNLAVPSMVTSMRLSGSAQRRRWYATFHLRSL